MGRVLLAVGFLLVSVPTVVAEDKKTDAQARAKAADTRFAKLKEYCKERRATHIVELLAEWGEFAGKEQQEVVLAMAAGLVKDARAEAEKLGESRGSPSAPRTEFRGVSATDEVKNLSKAASAYFVDEFTAVQIRFFNPGNDRALKRHVIVAAKVLLTHPSDCADDCVIFTNDPDAEIQGVEHSVIVASGNLKSHDIFQYSTVVCRGEVEYRMMEKECSFIKAGGQLVETLTRQSNGTFPQTKPDPRRAFPNDKDLLGVKFYATAEDGLEATAAKGVVTVSKLDEKKAFGKAGVQTGDVIETVNGENVPSLHELDRLVCRAMVGSGTAKVKVTRGEKAVEVEVKLFDWSAYTPDTKKEKK